MKIAFGTTLLDKGLLGDGIDGIGQYCQELLRHFASETNDLEIAPYSFGLNQSTCDAYSLPAYPSYLAKSLLRVDVKPKEDQFFNGFDLIHSTDQLIPIIRNKPLLATVMDTIPLSHPQFLRAQSRFFKPYLWKKLTQRANHIITISEFSRGEIINLMGFPEEKVTAIPLGVNKTFFERVAQGEIQSTLSKFKIDKPFFLFIGSIQPRKNLKRIIAAHAALPGDMATEFPLVIAGKLAWNDESTNTAIRNGVFEGRCIQLSYVTELEKHHLLQSALGLVFASLYEGFGLPILEAYASKCPVVTSNCTSMPEVSNSAAILVEPENIDSIADAMHLLINRSATVTENIIKGYAMAQQFTWSKTTAETQKIYSLFQTHK
ncbi:glycosyltransferase family 1 protein [Polynucleobacter sp. AP-Kaivos-20-H2]|uniref:glycosyltransferase family 4 protein n=1 Tax=Polynucleobacter sp. AP-Kaivos-20-H2 TaxID=2689104 RepID=UPI001C0B9AC4|nr:glycosyltransferase family 1 protein [Polynucleobacter sp. AP-Kaivos-20-H2]MBU3604148.1 glycosyltransferase family 4 protein [Polynucleobacter sp. AP-Kaivos-20-H2]